jgi:hypothetical protein
MTLSGTAYGAMSRARTPKAQRTKIFSYQKAILRKRGVFKKELIPNSDPSHSYYHIYSRMTRMLIRSCKPRRADFGNISPAKGKICPEPSKCLTRKSTTHQSEML